MNITDILEYAAIAVFAVLVMSGLEIVKNKLRLIVKRLNRTPKMG